MQENNNSLPQKQKSPQKRFLFVIGILFLIVFFILGLVVMFWKGLRLEMTQNVRYMFGMLLIGYSIIRFSRLLKNKDDE